MNKVNKQGKIYCKDLKGATAREQRIKLERLEDQISLFVLAVLLAIAMWAGANFWMLEG